MAELVNVDNFIDAETSLMFSRLVTDAGGVGQLIHYREPAPLEHQPIIRQNRDTLYSSAIVDVSGGVELTLPDSGDRYLSVMVVNQHHYIPTILHDGGTHHLDAEMVGSQFALFAVRILVDPADPADVAQVNALQDQIVLSSGSNQPFVPLDYDQASLTSTRQALLELSRGVANFRGAFGKPDEVDPVRRLLGAAAGWGGLPDYEANYINVDPGLPVGEYAIRMADVPVDAFWSISLYNADGYFEPNSLGVYNINSVTATPDPDGAVTVRFGTNPRGTPNYLPIMDGWNFLIRMYQPRQEVLDGSWTPPQVTPAA